MGRECPECGSEDIGTRGWIFKYYICEDCGWTSE